MTELLANHTSLRVGGPAKDFAVVETTQDLIDVVNDCDSGNKPVLILGGGSNLVVSDDGFPGTVVKVATSGVDVMDHPGGGITVTVEAGEPWDRFVARAVSEGWVGVESLAGIPGSVGAAPVQNVGAYGQEVSQSILRVQVFDRLNRVPLTMEASACRFGYRDSVFKTEPERYLVLAVVFLLGTDGVSLPIRYKELAARLDVEPGGRAPTADVREAVLALRTGKGMVVDPRDHDTWSAGSFFTNPVLPKVRADRLPPSAPRFAQPDQTVKTSAAWLIENAGFPKGYGVPPVTLSTKHTLALTNRGGAKTSDVLALAREIQAGVEHVFGVRLEPEPILVGCHL